MRKPKFKVEIDELGWCGATDQPYYCGRVLVWVDEYNCCDEGIWICLTETKEYASAAKAEAAAKVMLDKIKVQFREAAS